MSKYKILSINTQLFYTQQMKMLCLKFLEGDIRFLYLHIDSQLNSRLLKCFHHLSNIWLWIRISYSEFVGVKVWKRKNSINNHTFNNQSPPVIVIYVHIHIQKALVCSKPHVFLNSIHGISLRYSKENTNHPRSSFTSNHWPRQ